MKKVNRLKRNEDFDKIIKEGKKRLNSHFIVYYLPSLSLDNQDFRIGISVGKKFGNAVTRNKQKRIVRNLVDINIGNIIQYDYVIISRPACLNSKFDIQDKKFSSIFREISDEKRK